MADFYAGKTAHDSMLAEPGYRARKEALDQALTPEVVTTLFREHSKRRGRPLPGGASVLLFGSMQAAARCVEGKEQPGEKKSWAYSESLALHVADPNYRFFSVGTLLPLRALRPDLQDVVISHSLTCLLKDSTW